MIDQAVYYDREEMNLGEVNERGTRRLLSPPFKPVAASKRKLKKRTHRQTVKLHKSVVYCGLCTGLDSRDLEMRFGLNRFDFDMDDYLRWTYRKGKRVYRGTGSCNKYIKK